MKSLSIAFRAITVLYYSKSHCLFALLTINSLPKERSKRVGRIEGKEETKSHPAININNHKTP